VESIVNELLIREIKSNNRRIKTGAHVRSNLQTNLLTVVAKRDSSFQVKYIYAKFVELLSYRSLVKNYFTKENK